MTEPTYLRYEMRLRSPAIVSTLSGDPNSAATQPFVPGSAIRGAMAARLLESGSDGSSEEFRKFILSGAIRYLHAYPKIEGARALPVLTSWKSMKDELTQAYDLAAFSGKITGPNDKFGDFWPTESLVSVGAPFFAAVGSVPTLGTPRIRARLHQQRDRVKGRPRKDRQETAHGAIFAYEYLEADQVFRGVIQVFPEASVHIERITELLSQPILIGRSRRAGYGGDAEITFCKDTPKEHDGAWDILTADVDAGECFRMMLTSAYIGRHPETGQIDPTALEHDLRRLLDGAVTVERCRWGFETIGGFNQKWRLEVPQVQAVAAGGVLVLRAKQRILRKDLDEIEHAGLGERRVEGFGRVLFVEHSESHKAICLDRPKEKPASPQDPITLSSDEHEQLDFLEERIVLAAAKVELDQVATEIANVNRKTLTNSLLGRVRTLFRGVHDNDTAKAALSKLGTWCNDKDDNPHALKKTAREKLEGCKLKKGNLMRWLKTLSKSSDHGSPGSWEKLVEATEMVDTSKLTGLAKCHHLTNKSSAERVLQQHAAVLTVRLIDAVFAALARQNRGGPQ